MVKIDGIIKLQITVIIQCKLHVQVQYTHVVHILENVCVKIASGFADVSTN